MRTSGPLRGPGCLFDRENPGEENPGKERKNGAETEYGNPAGGIAGGSPGEHRNGRNRHSGDWFSCRRPLRRSAWCWAPRHFLRPSIAWRSGLRTTGGRRRLLTAFLILLCLLYCRPSRRFALQGKQVGGRRRHSDICCGDVPRSGTGTSFCKERCVTVRTFLFPENRVHLSYRQNRKCTKMVHRRGCRKGRQKT